MSGSEQLFQKLRVNEVLEVTSDRSHPHVHPGPTEFERKGFSPPSRTRYIVCGVLGKIKLQAPCSKRNDFNVATCGVTQRAHRQPQRCLASI